MGPCVIRLKDTQSISVETSCMLLTTRVSMLCHNPNSSLVSPLANSPAVNLFVVVLKHVCGRTLQRGPVPCLVTSFGSCFDGGR